MALRRRCILPVISLLLAPGVIAGPLAAQVMLSGIVTDSATSRPIASARIELLGIGGGGVRRAESDPAGRFRFTTLAPGEYAITIARIGYAGWRGVRVSADSGENRLAIALSRRYLLDPIIVTARRRPEASLDVPEASSVVSREEIAGRIALSPTAHLAPLPGIDVAQKGLFQATYGARGSRGASSGAMLTLIDRRLAALPAIGANVPYLLAPGPEDIERIEVVRGPAAAVYGPGTERGVVHIITRSPFDSRGATMTVGGGGREVVLGSMRAAARFGDRVAAKVSARYAGGNDWVYTDPIEAANLEQRRERASADTLLVGRRDPRAERFGADARLDWRASGATTVVLGAGYARAISAVDLEPTIGSVQLRGWGLAHAHAQVTSGALFAQLFASGSHSGDSYALRTGQRLVDKSRLLDLQLQYGGHPVDRVRLDYGVDVRRTDPRTDGTIHGRNEDRDLVTETGAWVQGAVQLRPTVELSGALRADRHSALAGAAWSPRLGVLVRPHAAHAFRATYDRAFSTPAPNDLFADLTVLPNLEGLPFAVRVAGVPGSGFQFRRDCGGLCVRSPFTPAGAGGADAFLPADASQLWDAAIGLLRANGGPDLSGIPAPGAGAVGSVLASLDVTDPEGRFVPVNAGGVIDIAPLRRGATDAFEVGYKGFPAKRVRVGVDVSLTRVRGFFGPARVGTPNLFLDAGSTAAYLAAYLPPDEAASLAEELARIPLAVATPANAADATDLLVLRRQGGSFTRLGIDLDLELAPAEWLALGAAYSWVNRDSAGSAGGGDEAVLSAPRNKGAVRIRATSARLGLAGRLEALAVQGYPVQSGVYSGRIEAYEVVNAGLDFGFGRGRRMTASLDVANLLDDVHQEFIGAPAIGRLLLVRLRTEF